MVFQLLRNINPAHFVAAVELSQGPPSLAWELAAATDLWAQRLRSAGKEGRGCTWEGADRPIFVMYIHQHVESVSQVFPATPMKNCSS